MKGDGYHATKQIIRQIASIEKKGLENIIITIVSIGKNGLENIIMTITEMKEIVEKDRHHGIDPIDTVMKGKGPHLTEIGGAIDNGQTIQ